MSQLTGGGVHQKFLLCFFVQNVALIRSLDFALLCSNVFSFASLSKALSKSFLLCPLSKVETLLKDLRQSGSQDTTYPKLRMAVETGQKEFVGHVYSQQVVNAGVLIVYCSHDGVI